MARLFSLLCLALLLWGCTTSTPVTVGGVPVTNEAFVLATRSVHAAELVSVGIGDFLISRHQTACQGLNDDAKKVVVACVQATKLLREYAMTYAPQVLKALFDARDTLRLVATTPASAGQEQLTQVLSIVTLTVAQASSWATAQGWTPLATTP